MQHAKLGPIPSEIEWLFVWYLL